MQNPYPKKRKKNVFKCLKSVSRSSTLIVGLHRYSFFFNRWIRVLISLQCDLSPFNMYGLKSYCKESKAIWTGMQCASRPNCMQFSCTAPVWAQACHIDPCLGSHGRGAGKLHEIRKGIAPHSCSNRVWFEPIHFVLAQISTAKVLILGVDEFLSTSIGTRTRIPVQSCVIWAHSLCLSSNRTAQVSVLGILSTSISTCQFKRKKNSISATVV